MSDQSDESDETETRTATDDESTNEMTETTDNPIEMETDESTAQSAKEPASGDSSDLRRKVNYALLAGLSLLALIAALQFYLNATSVINQWVTHEYRSLFQATFNLVVLLVAAAGISRQVRRLAG